MLRIGKQRDGSKVGVFIYCQQHAREWVTPITCLETAERLLRNYAIDPQTKELLDNLDVFIIPSVNPDGSHYSLYDNNNQRRNMVNHCLPDTFQDPLARTAWGVDLNRNNSVGTVFDGYVGAAAVNPANPATFNQCTSDVFAGPSEVSEAEIKNEQWVADTFSNIKFAINIHTYGGYFMWAPGAYKAQGRETLPAPNIGIERYFFDVADTILARIKEHRNTIIEPERTGPIADVLYSAAGNSADDQYYRKGIVSYSFEAGSRIFAVNQQTGEITRTDVGGGGFDGFRPDFETEGRHEAFEFTRRQLRAARERAAVLARRDPAGDAARLRRRDEGHGAADQLPLHLARRGGRDPLHDRRLDADAGLAHVRGQGPRPPGPGAQPGPPRHPRRQVDRGRHEGQRLARAAAAVPDRAGADRERDRAATLSLTVAARVVRRVHGGVEREYTATTTANVISSAGDAALSVRPDTTGQLANGAFTLPEALQVNGRGCRGRRLGEDDLDARRLQRPRDGDVQAAHRGDRPVAHGHLQQDADLHALDDQPIIGGREHPR